MANRSGENLLRRSSDISDVESQSNNINSNIQRASLYEDGRLSSSYSRSYYSNLSRTMGGDGLVPSYTCDEEAIRNQTLALANQGLCTVPEEGGHVNELLNKPANSTASQGGANSNNTTSLRNIGLKSNLSQLMHDYGSKLTTEPNRQQSGAASVVADDQLDNSDEEDFEDQLASPVRPNLPRATTSSSILLPNLKATVDHKECDSTPLLSKSLPKFNNNSYHSINLDAAHYPSKEPQSITPSLASPDGLKHQPTLGLGKKEHSDNPFLLMYQEVYMNTKFNEFSFYQEQAHLAIRSIPAVLIGTMLNILDSVSFGKLKYFSRIALFTKSHVWGLVFFAAVGVIIFPTALSAFSDFGPDGIAIFLVTTVIAQLVYSAGGSTFGGGNGGFMIEVVPFFHIICNIIVDDLGDQGKDMVVPTTMVAFALSTLVTGFVFLGLGWFKLGSLMEFFPRHILIGCIGGVGLFLMATGLELTTQISPTYDWSIWQSYLSWELLPLWSSAMILAISLQFITRWVQHPFLAPGFFLSIPVLFYFLVLVLGWDLASLRAQGWLFPLPTPVKPFYDFYLNFSFAKTSWSTLPKVFPAILSLTFFGILHVPINVPALAASTGVQELDINRELVSHGVSNILSGCFGSVQNYLIYSNSVLFIRSGGSSRISGLMLALSTFGVLLMGPGIIGFIPTTLVGSLIFHMGMELMKEALYDTYRLVHPLEYLTILSIVLVMGLIGFIEGIFLGIVLACLFFVVIYSHRSPVRNVLDGTRIRSTVRRLYHQRTFLELVGAQVQIMYLQGFMFFGTVHQLDKAITQLIRSYTQRSLPLRFLILDFTLVNGIDFSATDAFLRLFHRLTSHRIYLIIAGVGLDSDMGKTLRTAGLCYSNDQPVNYCQHFENCNQALEWCENFLLTNLYTLYPSPFNNTNNTSSNQLANNVSTSSVTSDMAITNTISTPSNQFPLELEYCASPRDQQLVDEAVRVCNQINETSALIKNARQPLGLLIQAFQEISDLNYPALHRLAQYFDRLHLAPNCTLWHGGDASDALYILESGLLRVTDPATGATDSVLPGTLVGEVTFLTNHARTGTITVANNDPAVVWRLTQASYAKILDHGAKDPSSPEAAIPYLLTKLALTYSAYDNRLYYDLARI